jgi:glycosyltransferase involved in cell wall biosynthesis
MRILFILTQDLESPSGLGRYFPLARELARKGNQVRIVTLHSNFNSLSSKQEKIGGVEVEYVAQMHVKKCGNHKSYFRFDQLVLIILMATIRLIKVSLSSDADIIFIGKPHPMNSIAGILVKLVNHVPIIVDCDDYEAGSNRFSSKWQKKTVAFFEKHIPKIANAVTTHTHFMLSNLVSWGIDQKKITYLPNGVDPARFIEPEYEKIKNKREELNIGDKKVIVYVGSLSSPSHPVGLLINAYAQLFNNFPNTVLMIVGGGEDMEELTRKALDLGIEENTRFIGHVNPNEIPLYYSLADVSVDPVYDNSAARGRSPLKLFESWICGVPFVSSNVGERTYLLGDPPAGILSPPDEVENLVKDIASVLQDERYSSELIARGKERVKDFYWEPISNILENLLNSCLYPNKNRRSE